jgi:DNA-binding protein YbaB
MKNPNAPMTREGMPTMDEGSLLSEIKNSIMAMQQQMQNTYAQLGETEVNGKSRDGLVEIVMTATYQFKDINFTQRALGDANGKYSLNDFKERIKEAWRDLSDKIQKTTQNKTIELLQGMNIPEDIKKISLEEEEGK